MPELEPTLGDTPRLALFDLDNTLFDRSRAFRSWCDVFITAHQLPKDAIDVLVSADADGHAPRSVVFDAVRAAYPLSESVDELTAEYRAQYSRFFLPDPPVLDALDRLRSHDWRIVIVTNGPPTQIDKIRATGLDNAVDGWCISDDVGSAKPDGAIFSAAAAVAGVPLSGYMVGDTIDADIVGGAAVGLRTIWLARGRSPDLAKTQPDVVVDDIAGALAHLLAL